MFMESGEVENQLESTGKIAPSDVASQAGNIPRSPDFRLMYSNSQSKAQSPAEMYELPERSLQSENGFSPRRAA